MSEARSLFSASDVAVVLLVAGAAVALGPVVLGQMPLFVAVGVVVAVAALWYLIRRPLHMVIAMVVVEVSGVAGVIAQHKPLPLFQLSLLAGAVALCIALRDPEMRERLNRGTVLCVGLLGCYLMTQLLTAFTSRDPSVSLGIMKENIADGLFLVVILLLTQITGRWWAVAAALVVPLAVISLLCLANQVVFAGTESFGGFATITEADGELVTTPRYGGPGFDSNFWGRSLILGVPLAGALAVRATQSGRRWVAWGWVSALGALLAGVYLTQSRGTMISTAVVLFVWVLASGPTAWRRGVKCLPLVGLVLLIPGIGNRLVALASSASGPNYAVDPSVLGRMAAQQSAWAMFRDEPIVGVGPRMYLPELPRYVGKVATAVLQPADAAHNLYAELAAHSGIVGLAGWTIFIGGFLALLALHLSRLPSGAAESVRSLPAGVLAAIAGWSVASVFLHMASFRTFAVVLALAGALGAARSQEVVKVLREKRHTTRTAVASIVAGSAAAFVVLAVSGTETYSASQTVTIMPTQRADPWTYAYALNVRSRKVLVPTYAALMNGGDSGFSATADPVRGVVKVSVEDPGEASARARIDAALIAADRNLANSGANASYTVTPVGSVDVHSSTTRSITSVALAVLAGTLIALATAFNMSVLRSTSPPHELEEEAAPERVGSK